MSWPLRGLDGLRGYKLVPGLNQPTHHFRRIADKSDWEVLDVVEGMTDERVRHEIGQIELSPANELFGGACAEPVMAALANINPRGDLFSDGSYGVFYLQMKEHAAIALAKHHYAAFLGATREKPIRPRLNLYTIGLAGDAADLRQEAAIRRGSAAGGSCTESRALGRRLRDAGIAAALYSDARIEGEDCLAVFRPSALINCRHYASIELSWDGSAIDGVTLATGSFLSASTKI